MYKKKLKKFKVNFWSVSTSLFLLLGLFVTLFLLRYAQNIRSNAMSLDDFNNSFVTVNGTNFLINDQPFHFTGVNMYDLASDPDTHNYDCGPVYSDADLDKSFSYFRSHNISVVRFWAFQTYVKGAGSTADWSNFNAHGPDWSGIDRAISYAKKYGLKLIPVLENTSPDCTEGGAHWFASWFTTGYQQPYGNYPLSYPDWVKLIVTRYKNEPAIMSWMLMNEAGDEEPIPSDWTPNSGTSMGVYNFTKNMSELIKSIDPNHLVTLGTIDGNRGGIGGPAYIYIHKLPTIDYIEVHDYGSDAQALPGSINNDGKTLPQNCSQTIACIVWEAVNDIKKPVIVGEAGINVTAGDTQSIQTRANEFQAKIGAFFNAGGVGYMIWHFDPNTSSGMDFAPGDPLGDILSQFGFPSPTIPTPSSGFVTTNGTKFMINGQPFTFVGFNLFDAANTPGYTCVSWTPYSDSELDQTFQYLHDQAGATVVRFWAYQTYTKGGTDWSGVDKVIAIAKKYNMKVIPVLEDGPGYCTTGSNGVAKWQYQGDTWYVNGYKVPYGNATLSYRDYVQKIVAHYKDEPTILGWMMMNEADTSAKNSNGKSVLVDFATDIGTLIKSIDPNHLVTVGTQSNGASGASGSDFTAVYGLPQIDFAEAHDYGYWASLTNNVTAGEQDPLPGSTNGITLPDPNSSTCQAQYKTAQIACSIAMANQVIHKPIVIGESGITLSGRTQAQRAQLFDAKMHAAFVNGVSGYLVWQANKVYDTGSGPYDAVPSFEPAANGQTDPLFAVMKKYSSDLPSSQNPTTIPLSQANTPTSTPIPTPLPTVSMSCASANAQPDTTSKYNMCWSLYTQGQKCTWGNHQNPDESGTPGCAVMNSAPNGAWCDWNNVCQSGMCNTATNKCVAKVVPTSTSYPTPTPTRKPTPTPTKRVVPTSTPKPLPTATPTPPSVQASSLTLLGSQMIVSSGTGAVYADSTATNGKGLVLYSNATAQGYITGSFGTLLIRAKEDECLGYPHINVLIDGHYVFDGNIMSTTFQTYKTDSFGYLGLNNVPHLVQVMYNNDFDIYFCDRNVRIDSITGQ